MVDLDSGAIRLRVAYQGSNLAVPYGRWNGNGRIKLGILVPRHGPVFRAELAAAPREAVEHAASWVPVTEWKAEWDFTFRRLLRWQA